MKQAEKAGEKGHDSPLAQRSDSFNSGQNKYEGKKEVNGKERRRIRAWAPSPSISSSEQSLLPSPSEENKPIVHDINYSPHSVSVHQVGILKNPVELCVVNNAITDYVVLLHWGSTFSNKKDLNSHFSVSSEADTL